MKFSYFMVMTLIVVGAFQYIRTTETSERYSLNQMYNFNKPAGRDGNIEVDSPQKHLVLYSESSDDEDVHYNLMETLKFTKLNYEEKNLFTDLEDLDGYSSIIFISQSYRGMKRDNFEKISEYLKGGGNLIFFKTSYSSPFNRDIGIVGNRDYIATEGIQFKESFFPGIDTLKPSKKMMPGSSLDVELKGDVRVIATDDMDTPLIWERRVGSGNIINVNTTLLEGKILRGVMTQLIAYGNDYSIMPVFNSKVVHLDDFPAPIPDGSNKLIYDDYRMKTRSFIKNIWWKDMEGIGRRQNLKYTGFLIGAYNDAVDPGKMGKFHKIHEEDLSYLGRKLVQQRGEIGAHGYNHLSLAVRGEIDFEEYNYKPWKSEKEMVFALRTLKDLMNDIYGEDVKVYSYVPPSNILTLRGKNALVTTFPNLKTLSGLYVGGEKGVLVQEIGRDPDYPELYSLPRFSSGLLCTEDTMWNIYNGIAAYGMVSHFFHPDDILDEDRGQGKPWEKLKESYEKIFEDINSNFSDMDPQVQSMATRRYMLMEDLEISSQRVEDTIRVNFKNFRGEVNTYVRLRREKIKDVVGGKFYIIDSAPEYNLYLVKFQREEGEILLGGA